MLGSPHAADEALPLAQALMAHAEVQRYRLALIDPPPRADVAALRAFRAGLNSSRAALYAPWVDVPAVAANEPALRLPPSALMAGICARTDVQRGVHKAPANELLQSALALEFNFATGQQELLNPEGINLLRRFEGRGLRVWGARTLSNDPEWRYVSVRRLFNYLERSIDLGTQWAVFEPNGELLWAQVRQAVEDFLFNQWRNGALLGSKPEEAYFVRCDRTTMTQADLDAGRLIALVGVAVVKPAEFVIFRVGQFTTQAVS
jgi:phage tail sheath protein FI